MVAMYCRIVGYSLVVPLRSVSVQDLDYMKSEVTQIETAEIFQESGLKELFCIV